MSVQKPDASSLYELFYVSPPDKNLNAKNQTIDQKELNQRINKLWADYSQKAIPNTNNLHA